MKVKSVINAIVKYLLPILLSALLFYYLCTMIDFTEMWQQISRCNFLWIGAALCVSVFSHVFRAMRWRIQLQALDIDTPLAPLTWSIFGTYAINLIFPRLGEVWRTGYIAQRQRAAFSVVFGSMVADRLADTATVLLITLATFFIARPAFILFADKYPQIYQGIINMIESPWLWIAVVIIIISFWCIFVAKTQHSLIIRTRRALYDLWHGFAGVWKIHNKGKWLVLTVAIWGCYFFQNYLTFFAFSFTADLGIISALVTFVLSSISMGIPTNGGLGAWHMAVIFALGLYGVDFDSAAAFAMVVWGTQTCLLVLLGIYTFVATTFDRKHSTN